MLQIRVIPCLLLQGAGLVKTVKFKKPTYLGDPRNIVKIFNEKEVDELMLLDITATIEKRPPDFSLISEIASECFMPVGYGGGIHTLNDIKKLFSIGIEKVVINSYAVEHPEFIKDASDIAGSQSIVVSIDVKKNIWSKDQVYIHSGKSNTKLDPVQLARQMQAFGAGEILLNSIDRDGTMQGYDIELIKMVAQSVDIPVVACGGAGTIADFALAVKQGGASAVAAGSMFVFQGAHRAVLISYPEYQELEQLFQA